MWKALTFAEHLGLVLSILQNEGSTMLHAIVTSAIKCYQCTTVWKYSTTAEPLGLVLSIL